MPGSGRCSREGRVRMGLTGDPIVSHRRRVVHRPPPWQRGRVSSHRPRRPQGTGSTLRGLPTFAGRAQLNSCPHRRPYRCCCRYSDWAHPKVFPIPLPICSRRDRASDTTAGEDRSSAPRRCPHALPDRTVHRVLKARRRLKRGPHHLGAVLGMPGPRSTGCSAEPA